MNRFFILLLLAQMGCASKASVEFADDVELPLINPHGIGMLMVEADLPGYGKLPIVLDTGANHSLLDRSVSVAAGLHIKKDWLPSRTVFANAVSWRRWECTHVDRMDLGAAHVIAFDPLMNDTPLANGAAAGILGGDALGQLRIWVNGPEQKLRLLNDAENIESALKSLDPRRTWISLHTRGVGVRYVDVIINGRAVSMMLDTGANGTSLSESLVKDLKLNPVSGLSNTSMDASGKAQTYDVFHIDDLRLGKWIFSGNISSGTTRLAGQDGILGFNVLSQIPFVWDGPGNRLWIGQPLEGESSQKTSSIIPMNK